MSYNILEFVMGTNKRKKVLILVVEVEMVVVVDNNAYPFFLMNYGILEFEDFVVDGGDHGVYLAMLNDVFVRMMWMVESKVLESFSDFFETNKNR